MTSTPSGSAGACPSPSSENDNALDFALTWSVRGFFRLSDARAAGIMDRVKEAVSGWERASRKLDLPSAEVAAMRRALPR
ncbi:MAG: hypothetical protein HY554_03570 [Elusimicrobia bacterium]|nr:hypothetical protein [Elusimicrobiota bacterium]